MAGVAVEMTDPAGRSTVRRSNFSGFVNFPMSASQRKAVIRKPGSYSFHVVVPEGWTVTSGNATQTTVFGRLPGAPADLIATNPALPVGLAPALVISGRVAMRSEAGTLVPAPGATVRAIGPGGVAAAVRVSATGSFAVPAAAGAWRLTAEGPALRARAERDVTVVDVPVVVSALVLDERGADTPQPVAARETVDFESVTGTPVAKIPCGVAGVDWNYLNAIDAVSAGGDGYVNTLVSGRYVGYSSSGHPVTISRPGGFDFVGAYLGVGLPQADGETLRVQAFRAGTEVAVEELRLSFLGPVWLAADFRAVDRVVLTTLHYWQFVTDDLVLAVPTGTGSAARPEAQRAVEPGR